MRVARTSLAVLAAGALVLPAMAQTPGAGQSGLVPPSSGAAGDLGCAPYLIVAPPDAGLQVVGSQATAVKRMMGPGDTLVIGGGRNRGLQTGQEFFIRRVTQAFGALGPSPANPLTVHTAGWARVLEVDSDFATAQVLHACEGILTGDFLEPYAAPLLAASPIDGQPHGEHFGRVLMGDEGRLMGGTGDFMTIDRGSDHGVTHGQRFSVYRDKGPAAGPLVEVGVLEAVQIRAESSTVRVIAARDAVMANDLVAIRR